MTRKKFTDEFRKEAVQLALNSDFSRKQIADDLGIGHSTLGKWITEHRHVDLMSGPHDDVQKELKRLRKENKILREERDILKKPQPSSRARKLRIPHAVCKASFYVINF